MSDRAEFTLSFEINDQEPMPDNYQSTVVIAKAFIEGKLWVAVEAGGFDASAVGAEDVCVFLEDVIASIRAENEEHLSAVPDTAEEPAVKPRRFNPQPVAKGKGWVKG